MRERERRTKASSPPPPRTHSYCKDIVFSGSYFPQSTCQPKIYFCLPASFFASSAKRRIFTLKLQSGLVLDARKVFFRKVPSIARRQQPIFQLLGRLVSNHSYTFKKASRQVERRSLTWNERQLFSNSSHKYFRWEIEHHKCKQKRPHESLI